ncbi:FAD/NAD-binding domain-containing protein [Mycena galopus ATCC 62051]|nr:FAD/NAD-binding domain-containing protein [Mycena galopus ATCC 62051]
MDALPPTHAKILIVGGGPAGSYAASVLQREGHEVVVFESAKFPRYHVGESMLPSMRGYLRFIDLDDTIMKHGFLPKPGAAFKLVHGMPHTWTDFSEMGADNSTWNMIRSEMDELFLRHAEKQGAKVFEDTRVESIDFRGEPASSRPIAANWVRKDGSTGNGSLMPPVGRESCRLKDRHFRESLRNVAVWGYWKDVKRWEEGTRRACSGWFEALTDETGWAWVIALHDGTTSIGFVMHLTASNAKKATTSGLTEHYLDQLQFAPGLRELVEGKGTMIPGSVKSAADYSYFASKYSGNHFRIIGDAANFVDPFFSSGGEVPEKLAQEWHDTKVGIAHTRFLFVVLGAYQQMHLQSYPILSDVNAKNFDDAFKMFHPVIFGTADSRSTLTDDKVQDMMDRFEIVCSPYVNETNVKAVRERYGPDIVTMEAPILGKAKIKELVKDDVEAERVLTQADAMRVFTDDIDIRHTGRHPLLGYVAHVVMGELGLKRFEEKKATDASS